VGTVASAYDNSLMETVIGLFRPTASAQPSSAGYYRTVADIEEATAGWVEWWNNR
jgi:putative transposase